MLGGLVLVEGFVWQNRFALGASIWVLQVGLSLMALGGVWNWVIPHRNGSASNKIDQPDSSVAPTFDTEKNIRETQAEWERLAQKIEQRDRDLSEKLKTFHEWMEFPLPSNLAEMSSTSKVSNEDLAEKDHPNVFLSVFSTMSIQSMVKYRSDGSEMIVTG